MFDTPSINVSDKTEQRLYENITIFIKNKYIVMYILILINIYKDKYKYKRIKWIKINKMILMMIHQKRYKIFINLDINYSWKYKSERWDYYERYNKVDINNVTIIVVGYFIIFHK